MVCTALGSHASDQIDVLFQKHDKDTSGTLKAEELHELLPIMDQHVIHPNSVKHGLTSLDPHWHLVTKLTIEEV